MSYVTIGQANTPGPLGVPGTRVEVAASSTGNAVHVSLTGRNTAAFKSLPHPALRLLLDVRYSYTGANNGRLMVTQSVLRHRGWTSVDTQRRALPELMARGFPRYTAIVPRTSDSVRIDGSRDFSE